MINDEILHKWVNGTITPKELIEFKQRPEFDALTAIYKNTEGLAAPEIEEERILSEILNQAKVRQMRPAAKQRRLIPQWVKYGVAASILLLGFWVFFPQNETVNYQTAYAESKEASLPDGSTFVLNADSELSFDKKDWDSNRALRLKGEAFFKVKKGSTFNVKTANGSVQVLGTQFNVRVRDEILEVKCQTGKVAVLSTTGKKLTELTEKKAVRVKSEKITENWELINKEDANWPSGIFRFKRVELAVVLAELERQFNIRIQSDLVNTTEVISTNFNKGNLEVALKSTLQPLGIDYKLNKSGKEVVLIK